MPTLNQSTALRCLKTLVCLALVIGASRAGAQFSYVNNSQGMQFVPYGGSYTYSVSWTNGAYDYNGNHGAWVSYFYKPGSSISINALYSSTGTFSYTIPFVTASDDGAYYLNLNGDGTNLITTSQVFMHVTPGILEQPTNASVLSGQATSLGLVAGPSTATYTWINAVTGATIGNGATFTPTTYTSGIWVYCKISNTYGYTVSSPVWLNVYTNTNTFAYANRNQGVEIVAYGKPFTYSVAWTNGTYYANGNYGTYIYTFFKPSGSLSINSLYSSTGDFSYTIPFVTSSDDGSYYLTLNGASGNGYNTSTVMMRVAPGIVSQPVDIYVPNGTSTNMGMIAGPTTATYTWINAANGNQIGSGTSFNATTSMDGMTVYCKISNTYGTVYSTPAVIHIKQFSYANNNQGVTIVPYGGTFNYAVSWTNGMYYASGPVGTWVNSFNKPSGTLNIAALYPANGAFSNSISFVTSTDDGAYYLSLNGTGSGSINTSTVFMHVAPAIITQPVETTVANNKATTMGLFAGPSTATFTWIDTATGSSIANGASFTANSSMDGKRIYCKISNTYGSTLSTPVLIHIGSLMPTITSQPTSATVVLGQSATFRVTASGAQPLAYAWYRNGYAIAGANENFITIATTTDSDAGNYSCMISNSYGITNTLSAMLSFATYPAIVQQPQSLTVTQGQNAVFTGAASGSPVYYSWYKDGNIVAGATNATLTISNVQGSAAGSYVFVAANGLATLFSTGAVLTVYYSPTISVPPADQTVEMGTGFIVGVTAAGYPAVAYQWRRNGTNITVATNTDYEVASSQTTDAGVYDVVITNSVGSITSSVANINMVYYPPLITDQPAGQTLIAAGSNATLSVGATGSVLNYQWYKYSTNTAAALPIVINGFVLGATVTNTGGGYVLAPNVQIIGGGGSGATATATISNGTVVAISIASTGSGYTNLPAIQIDPPAVSLTNQTAAALNLPVATTNDAGTYFVVVANAAGSVTSSNATLTVNVPLYITSQPQSQSVPPGSNVTFAVSVVGTAPFGYQWYYASPAQATATASILNGFVYGANIDNVGAGYTSAPNVQISGGGGSGATAIAVVSNGMVTVVNVISTGSGYTNAPTLQIDPPAGGALSGQTNSIFNIAGVSTNNVGNYFVVVTDGFGSVTSSLASLSINNGATSNAIQIPLAPMMAVAVNGSGLRLQFTGTPNYPYILQSATNLTPPINWQSISTNPADINGNWQFTDTNLTGVQRFYRAMGQ